MGFNGPGANSWWVDRSNRNNPHHIDYETDGLTTLLDSDTKNYSSDSNGFLDYASGVSNKFSYAIAASAAFGILLAACSGGASSQVIEPTARPTRKRKRARINSRLLGAANGICMPHEG